MSRTRPWRCSRLWERQQGWCWWGHGFTPRESGGRRSCQDRRSELRLYGGLICACMITDHYTGVAVFRGGLKKGRAVTFTLVFSRTASIVTSICSDVPGLEYSVSMLASAIIFFRIGDQLVVVALPTCFSSEYTGTATREACAGAAGVRP